MLITTNSKRNHVTAFNNVHEKEHQRSQDRRLLKRARAICNLHSCYNFALVLHENAFVFSQLEAQVDYYTENTKNVHYARIASWLSEDLHVLHKTFTDLREKMGNKQE